MIQLQLKNKSALFISDLHIGINSYSNKVIKYIYDSLDKYDYIILLGDVIEGLRYIRSNWYCDRPEDKIYKVLRSYPALLDLLKHENVYYVLGNHDEAFIKLPKDIIDGVKWTYGIISDDIYAIHGDSVFGSGEVITNRVPWYLTLLDFLTPSYLDRLISKYMILSQDNYPKIKSFVSSCKFNNIIMGHTHSQLTFLFEHNKTYYNTGCCTFGTIQGVKLNYNGDLLPFTVLL